MTFDFSNLKLDGVYVLSAGFGTRMGKIGTNVPKILWPLGHQTMLDWQYQYVRSFFQGPIYFNIHYLYEEVEKYINENQNRFSDVSLIYEPEILEIGGAIHNLAANLKVPYQGTFLILNCDQFLLFDSSKLLALRDHVNVCPVALASIEVPNSGYNAIEVENGKLKRIVLNPPRELPTIHTYAGVSLIDLSKIERHSGKSKFFQTVAKFETFPVAVEHLKKEKYPYWDFGTKERYVESILSLWQLGCAHALTHSLELAMYHNLQVHISPNKDSIAIVCGRLRILVSELGEVSYIYECSNGKIIEDYSSVELTSSLRSLIASTGQTSTHR